MERLFHLKERGSDPRTEMLAGLSTFLTMAYIVVVNPSIMAAAGIDQGAAFVATCLAAAIGSMLMGVIANFPIALAPGMGLNAYFAFAVVQGMGVPWQVALGLLRYAAHTLSFDEASPRQKRWALQSAGLWTEIVERFLQDERALRPGWVSLEGCGVPASAGLAVIPCPGRTDRARDLEEDLGVLRRADVTALFGWITTPELERVGVAHLAACAAGHGLAYHRCSVPDQRVPSIEEAVAAVDEAVALLARGERVALHCLGGLGRSGTLAACVLVHRGIAPTEAVARVREARGPRAVETAEQENFVADFAQVVATR